MNFDSSNRFEFATPSIGYIQVSDAGYELGEFLLDSEDNDTVYDGSVWDSILGSGLGEVFAGVFNEAPVELVDRLNEAEVDIPSLLGSNLDSLLTDSALSEFETNLSLFEFKFCDYGRDYSRISAISEGIRVEVTGDNFNASFQDMLELLAGGGSNFDSFVDLIDGQISQIKTTDTSTGRSVSLNIINNDGDMDAERFFIEAEDASLELTGRLPRDIQDIKQLFDLASISEGEAWL